MKIITNNPAPEFTPIILVDANGLFKTACMAAPATERAAPAIIEAITRGIRR